MKDFIENLEDTLDDEFNVSVTENGAVGFRTSGKALLDLNFEVSSLRRSNAAGIIEEYKKAFYADKEYAIKWLFFAGDVRCGMGERKLFRACMRFLAESEPEIATALLPFVPEYTRWDALACLVASPVGDKAAQIIADRLAEDVQNKAKRKPVSLCAKWMPSVNASSKEARSLARTICGRLKMTAKQYRTVLAELRAYLDVTEVKMSRGDWAKIKYSAVPSRANLIYNGAFLRHDEQRRRKYLESVKKGEEKINSGVLYPHDIVHKYIGAFGTPKPTDDTLEELWKALPDYVNGRGGTLCVADGSGSMCYASIGSARVTPLAVANALAVYFAERCTGEFKDKYITFSEHPQLVDFSHCKTLHDKLGVALAHNEVANTNVEAVFDLILATAVKHKMPQSDMPKTVLVLSDMEFDSCAHSADGKALQPRLFEVISARYEANGYKLPRLVFWNIGSRTCTVPIRENALGVALVSGFSPAITDMVLANELDPFVCLQKQLDVPRYQTVFDAVKPLLL